MTIGSVLVEFRRVNKEVTKSTFPNVRRRPRRTRTDKVDRGRVGSGSGWIVTQLGPDDGSR